MFLNYYPKSVGTFNLDGPADNRDEFAWWFSQPSSDTVMTSYISLVARCLIVIANFKPTSMAFLNLCTPSWCSGVCIRQWGQKLQVVSWPNSSGNLWYQSVLRQVVIASFFFFLNDLWHDTGDLWLLLLSGWWWVLWWRCWLCGRSRS